MLSKRRRQQGVTSSNCANPDGLGPAVTVTSEDRNITGSTGRKLWVTQSVASGRPIFRRADRPDLWRALSQARSLSEMGRFCQPRFGQHFCRFLACHGLERRNASRRCSSRASATPSPRATPSQYQRSVPKNMYELRRAQSAECRCTPPMPTARRIHARLVSVGSLMIVSVAGSPDSQRSSSIAS